MIDFPATPVNGQIFLASNGVTYQWDSTATLWKAVGTTTLNVTGDFSASSTSAQALATGGTTYVLVPTGILSGNVNAVYNTGNGRYTPPAGRYNIEAWAQFNVNTAAAQFTFSIWKNGAMQFGVSGFQPTANGYCTVPLTATVDANGTDYFEIRGASSFSTASCWSGFTAIPVGVTMAIPAATGADFFASNSASLSLPTASQVYPIIVNTIANGNAGNWYNTATGRFTPPAGRYNLYANGYFTSPANATNILYFYKNGVAVGGASNASYQATAAASCAVSLNAPVDANGTDYFELRALCNQANGVLNVIGFGAVPIGVAVALPLPSNKPDGFFLFNTVDKAVVNASSTAAMFATAEGPTFLYNRNTPFTLSSTGVFTCQRAGLYQFDFNSTLQCGGATCQPGISIVTRVGGTGSYSGFSTLGGNYNQQGWSGHLTCTFDLAAGDTIEVWITSQQSVGTVTAYANVVVAGVGTTTRAQSFVCTKIGG